MRGGLEKLRVKAAQIKVRIIYNILGFVDAVVNAAVLVPRDLTVYEGRKMLNK